MPKDNNDTRKNEEYFEQDFDAYEDKFFTDIVETFHIIKDHIV